MHINKVMMPRNLGGKFSFIATFLELLNVKHVLGGKKQNRQFGNRASLKRRNTICKLSITDEESSRSHDQIRAAEKTVQRLELLFHY